MTIKKLSRVLLAWFVAMAFFVVVLFPALLVVAVPVATVSYAGHNGLGCFDITGAATTSYPVSGDFIFTGFNYFIFQFDFGEPVTVSDVVVTQIFNGNFADGMQVCYSDTIGDWQVGGENLSTGLGDNVITVTETEAHRYWIVRSVGLYNWTRVTGIVVNAESGETPTPSATVTLTSTSLPLQEYPDLPAWCPVGTAEFGDEYSPTWLRNCGCLVGAARIVTATATGSSTPTPNPDALTQLALTATSTLTVTPAPTQTSTSYFTGCRSYDCSLTATARPGYIMSQAAATPTVAQVDSQSAIEAYCSAPVTVQEFVSFQGPIYDETICLPQFPALSFDVEGVSMFGFVLPDLQFDFPGLAVCLELYTVPAIQIVGIVIYLDYLLVVGIALRWIFYQFGRV